MRCSHSSRNSSCVRAPPASVKFATSPSSSSESTRCHLERRMACRLQSVPSSSLSAPHVDAAGLRLVAQRLHLLAEPEEVEAGVEDAGHAAHRRARELAQTLHVLRLGAPHEIGEAVEAGDHLGGRARGRAPLARVDGGLHAAAALRAVVGAGLPPVGLLRRRAAGHGQGTAPTPRRHRLARLDERDAEPLGLLAGQQRHDRAGRQRQRGARGVGPQDVLDGDHAAGVDGVRGARRGDRRRCRRPRAAMRRRCRARRAPRPRGRRCGRSGRRSLRHPHLHRQRARAAGSRGPTRAARRGPR